MPSLAKDLPGRPGRLWCRAVICTVCLTGCCGGIVPSVRIASCPEAAVDPLAPAADPHCAVPRAGYCGADDCPSLCAGAAHGLKPLAHCFKPLARGLGPLAHPRRASAMMEAELRPPHSRFHPVPTAPVFAQRNEYEPPSLMMQPVPAHGRPAPQSLPHVSDVQPLPSSVPRPAPATETGPAALPSDGVLPERLPVPPQPQPQPQPDGEAAREPGSVRLLRR